MECKICNREMKLRKGNYGEFWGCSGYPDCKHTEQAEQTSPNAPQGGSTPSNPETGLSALGEQIVAFRKEINERLDKLSEFLKTNLGGGE